MNNNGERKLFVPIIVETEPPLLRVGIGIDFRAVVGSWNHAERLSSEELSLHFEIVGGESRREVDFFIDVCSYLPTGMYIYFYTEGRYTHILGNLHNRIRENECLGMQDQITSAT